MNYVIHFTSDYLTVTAHTEAENEEQALEIAQSICKEEGLPTHVFLTCQVTAEVI